MQSARGDCILIFNECNLKDEWRSEIGKGGVTLAKIALIKSNQSLI